MGFLLSVLHTVLPTGVSDLGGEVSDLHVHTSPSTHLGDNGSYCLCLLGYATVPRCLMKIIPNVFVNVFWVRLTFKFNLL